MHNLLLTLLQGGPDPDRVPVTRVLSNAFKVFFDNFHIAIAIAAITGGAGFVLTDSVGLTLVDQLQITDAKMQLIASTFIQTGLLCVWAGLVGAWAAPAQIYLWVQRAKGQPATLSGAVNYGLNRWSRVAVPHFLAYLAIALGNIIIVPGIIFGLQYAFVDAIATLDQVEKAPLNRSGRLTGIRRHAILGTMTVFLLGWWLWFQLGLVFFLPSLPIWGKFALGTVDHVVLLLVDLCMVQLYLDLFRKGPVEKPASVPAVAPAAALPGASDNPWESKDEGGSGPA